MPEHHHPILSLIVPIYGVEAYVGEWTQLDPTFGQDVANPARLAVGEESSAEITPLIGSMTVVEVR